MENQATYHHAHFSQLAHEDKVWAGVLFGGALVLAVVAVLTALAVHCYHRRWGSARAQRARDEEEAAWASEVQLLAAHLAASQTRAAQELEVELVTAYDWTSSLQAQVTELERRLHGVFEELRQEREKVSVLERKLSLTEQARDLEKEVQQTSYAMYRQAAREVEELQGRLLAVQGELWTEDAVLPEAYIHVPPSAPPMVATAPPVLAAAEPESETDYFSAA